MIGSLVADERILLPSSPCSGARGGRQHYNHPRDAAAASTTTPGRFPPMPRPLLLTVALALALSPTASAKDPKKMVYPPTRAQDTTDRLHGVEVADPYRWLEEADNPETRAWVEQQNSFTRSVLDKLPGREKIRERLSALLDIGVLGTPTPRKGR